MGRKGEKRPFKGICLTNSEYLGKCNSQILADRTMMTQFLIEVVISVTTAALIATAIVVVPLAISFYVWRWVRIRGKSDLP